MRELRNNKRTQKNKVGEGETNQPSHVVSSQQDTIINKDSNTSLPMSSQKGMNIENSSHPKAQNTREGTKFKHIPPYVRKKKEGKETTILGEHTQPIPKITSFENEPLYSFLDASHANAEIQPHSLSVRSKYVCRRGVEYKLYCFIEFVRFVKY